MLTHLSNYLIYTMNAQAKNRHSEIVNEIKQQILKLTQENDVLRNCWKKEQIENEELRRRVLLLTSKNALLQHENNSLHSQMHLLEESLRRNYSPANLSQNMRSCGCVEKIAHPVRHFERRVHNLDDGKIFKGNKGNKGNSPTR